MRSPAQQRFLVGRNIESKKGEKREGIARSNATDQQGSGDSSSKQSR